MLPTGLLLFLFLHSLEFPLGVFGVVFAVGRLPGFSGVARRAVSWHFQQSSKLRRSVGRCRWSECKTMSMNEENVNVGWIEGMKKATV